MVSLGLLDFYAHLIGDVDLIPDKTDYLRYAPH